MTNTSSEGWEDPKTTSFNEYEALQNSDRVPMTWTKQHRNTQASKYVEWVNMLKVPLWKEDGEITGQMRKMTLDMMNGTGWSEKKKMPV